MQWKRNPKQDPSKKKHMFLEKFVSDMVKSLQLGAINEFKSIIDVDSLNR